MHNLNTKAASRASDAIPLSPQPAQPLPFPKAGHPSAADFPPSSVQAATKRLIDNVHGADGVASGGDDFVKRLVEGAHTAIDKLADAAGPTVGRIAGAFSNPSGRASGVMAQAGNKKDAWLSDLRDIVREHPIAAIAVVLAAGAVYVKLTATLSRDPRDGLDD